MTTPQVAVIGGGAAGLSAALRLHELGVTPVLLEADAAVGGVIRTVRRDGWIAEAGPNTLAEPEPAVRAMLDAAGLGPETVRATATNARRYLVHQGVPIAVPRSVGELVSWPVLSTAGRMRLLKEPFVRAGDPDLEESVDGFVRRRLGDEMAERVFDPLIAGTSAGDPSRLLVRYALPRMLEWEQRGGSLLKGAMRSGMDARRRSGKSRASPKGSWSCRDGLSQLSDKLSTALGDSIRTGVQVAQVVRRTDGFEVVDAVGQRERFDAVVCAAPARALAGIAFGAPADEVLAEVAAVPHASLATVSLGYRREQVAHPLDGYGLLVPFRERRQILGTLFASSLFDGRAPDGHVLLTTFVGGTRQAELAAWAEADLVAMVRSELAELLGARGDHVFAVVARWPECQPQAVAGHTARLVAVASVESSLPGLAFAGSWHDGLALGDVMRGGRAAVDRLAARMPWMA
ncbi:MAG: protoporphyrinogen oxidase [Gemmatimonadota bacterium]